MTKRLRLTPILVAVIAVRIVARRVDDGRIEFGLQMKGDVTAGGDDWRERFLPRFRFFHRRLSANALDLLCLCHTLRDRAIARHEMVETVRF